MGIADYGFCIEGIILVCGLLFLRSYDQFSRSIKIFMIANLVSLILIKLYSEFGIVFLIANNDLSMSFISKVTVIIKVIQAIIIVGSIIYVINKLVKNMSRVKYYGRN